MTRITDRLSVTGLCLPQAARDYCQRVVQVLKKLKTNRRMGLSEIQLTIEIEQPEEIERNKVLGIEVRSCASAPFDIHKSRKREMAGST